MKLSLLAALRVASLLGFLAVAAAAPTPGASGSRSSRGSTAPTVDWDYASFDPRPGAVSTSPRQRR